MLNPREYRQLIGVMNKRLDVEMEDAIQATVNAIEKGKDTVGRNEDKPWWDKSDDDEQ